MRAATHPMGLEDATDAAGPLAPIRVARPQDLAALFDGGWRDRRRPIVLQLAGLSQPQALEAAERLNRERRACGCGEGAVGLFAGLLVTAALIAVRYGPLTASALVRYPLAVVAAFLALGAGKALGLALARRRGRRLARQLVALTTPST